MVRSQEGDYIDNNVVVKACAAKLSEEQATAVDYQIWDSSACA